jgi:phosphate-selective porin OprO/OprP
MPLPPLAVWRWLTIQALFALYSGLAQGQAPAELPLALPPLPGVEEAPRESGPHPEIRGLEDRLAALEESEAKRVETEVSKRNADALKPTIKWAAQLQYDSYFFNQDAANVAQFGDIPNGGAFRRARLGAFGDYGPSEYRVEMDFALSGRPTFLDVYAGINDLPGAGRVRVGHFFEPFSLERLTANRFTIFMERSLLDQAFVPARNSGIMANNTWLGEYGTWGLGLFRSDSDAFGDDVGDNFERAVTGRVTVLPYYGCEGRHYVHLGGAYSIRGTDDGVARFRAQPEARLGAATPNVPFFVDTGDIPADFFQLGGIEMAWVNGPLSLQGEYALTSVDADNGTSPRFDGWYVLASYFLTGEHRPYRKDAGAFDRVVPYRDFVRYRGAAEEGCLCVGPGAWEIAARVSQVELNDEPIVGGRETNLTVGLNWYLSPYLRYTTNYVHAFVHDSAGIDSETDIFAMRVGYEF